MTIPKSKHTIAARIEFTEGRKAVQIKIPEIKDGLGQIFHG